MRVHDVGVEMSSNEATAFSFVVIREYKGDEFGGDTLTHVTMERWSETMK